MAKLVEALHELASEDVCGVAQRDVIVALDRMRARLDAEVSRRLGELDGQGEHRVLGYQSAAAVHGRPHALRTQRRLAASARRPPAYGGFHFSRATGVVFR